MDLNTCGSDRNRRRETRGRWLARWCLGLCLGASLLGQLSTDLIGQEYAVPDVSVQIAGTVTVPYTITSPTPTSTSGIQFFFRPNAGSDLTIASVELGADALAVRGGQGPEFFNALVQNDQSDPQGWGASGGMIWTFAQTEFVSVGPQPGHFLDITIAAGSTPGVYALEFDDTVPFPTPTLHSLVLPGGGEVPLTGTGNTVTVVAPVQFTRGDTNSTGHFSLVDAVIILAFMNGVLPGGVVTCDASMDTNADANVDLQDVIFLLAYIFQGGPSPTAGICADLTTTADCAASTCP